MALAAALAIHEIIAGLIPNFFAKQTEQAPESVEHVTIARIIHTPSPKPSPTPTPKPPPVKQLQVTRNVSVVSPITTPIPAPVGKAATASPIKRNAAPRPKPPKTVVHEIAQNHVPTGGQGAGAGTAAGAGSLGNGTNGNGTGNTGEGAGGGGAPCGAVDFAEMGPPVQDPQNGFLEYTKVSAVVHYPDGHTDTIPLDWVWRYKNASVDPFQHPDLPMFFQFPPAAQRADEPPIVQYIMKYSTSFGGAKLPECGNEGPPVTPHPGTR